MAIRPKAWAKRKLTIPAWATPRSWLSRSEAASLFGVPRSTLQRLALRGEGPAFEAERFTGNAVHYNLMSLLLWFGRVSGQLPLDFDEMWMWWIDRHLNLKEHRSLPQERGNRPRGLRRRRWKQVCRVRTRNDLLWAKVAVAAIDASHPQARRDLLDIAQNLRKAPARS